jgi:peptidoglycan/xylan/chitin deacetylase (PgdA/CDA1 family)
MTTPMTPRERAGYSAIVDRPALQLPDGARVVVWTIVNLEVWDSVRAMPRQVLPAPMGQPLLPDVPNWSWHEYGMRVGVWRYFELFRALNIRPSTAINGQVCEVYPRVTQAAKDAGWDFIAHGYEQIPMHKVEDQPRAIKRALDTLERAAGKRPIGWLAPGLTQTLETMDHLAAAGLRYTCDFAHDEEPSTIQTANGNLVTLPYTVEMSDITVMALQHHGGEVFYQRGVDQFERLYREGGERAKIMSIALHPYLTGHPHRFAHLERLYRHLKRDGVLFWTGAEIYDWYVKNAGLKA